MTSNVKLLPLPKWMESFVIPGDAHGDQTLSDRMTAYALANVLHHTAPLRYALGNAALSIKSLRGVMDSHAAEIEALRAEREVIVAEAVKYADKSGRLEAKVDRLAEAGRMVTAAFRAHGEASHECEAAMLSLADAIEAASA